MHDDFLGRGIGTFLLRYLSQIAGEQGITAFTADLLAENHAMTWVFHKVGRSLETNLTNDLIHVRFDLSVDKPAAGVAKPDVASR